MPTASAARVLLHLRSNRNRVLERCDFDFTEIDLELKKSRLTPGEDIASIRKGINTHLNFI
jgi:hypothetical protein